MLKTIAALDKRNIVTGLYLFDSAVEVPPFDYYAEADETVVIGDTYTSDGWQYTGDRTPSAPEPTPEPGPTTEERLAALERENKTLQSQLEASIQSNQMLEDCLVEMAGIVYA